MRAKSLDFSEVYDVRALRVIVPDLKDCYTALGIVHNLWLPIPKEFDDYIAKPFSPDELRRALKQAADAFGLGGGPEMRLRTELGRQIRLARTARDWTLKDLSESSGVSVSQLSSIERGAHLPSLESLLAVATALESHPSEWLRAAGF